MQAPSVFRSCVYTFLCLFVCSSVCNCVSVCVYQVVARGYQLFVVLWLCLDVTARIPGLLSKEFMLKVVSIRFESLELDWEFDDCLSGVFWDAFRCTRSDSDGPTALVIILLKWRLCAIWFLQVCITIPKRTPKRKDPIVAIKMSAPSPRSNSHQFRQPFGSSGQLHSS